MSTDSDGRVQYEAPALQVLGQLHELTQADKISGMTDGMFLLGVGPITNASA